MHGRLLAFALLIFVALCAGCQSTDTDGQQGRPREAAAPAAELDQPLAYIAGEPVRARDLLPPMLEAEGGNVLAELVLDRTLQRRLNERGLVVSADRIEAERQLLLDALDPDPDQAARLLRELRGRRGLGEQRFTALLERNAALRLLVEDQVQVTEAALEQAHAEQFGPRYQPRLIVVERLSEAAELRAKLLADPALFAELASVHSTDASAAQGGLLPPISPADDSYPAAVREALVRLDGAAEPISEAIALDHGFALLKLESKLPAQAVELDDKRSELGDYIRQRAEQTQMRQLARQILQETNVVVLDPALGQSWRDQREQLVNP